MALNSKQAIAEIKKLLFGDVPPPAPAPAPEAAAAVPVDYKLQDGSTVSIDKLEVGGIVTIAGAVAPDGEYCLEDGTCVTVAAGVISAVTPATPVESPAPEAMVAPVVGVTPAQMQEAIKQVSDTFQEKFKEQKEANKLLIDLIEGFAEESKDEPTETTKEWDSMTPLERRRFLKTQK